MTLTRHSIFIAAGMLIVATLTLCLSLWQFTLARAERKEASEALDLAHKAQEAADLAQTRIREHEDAIIMLEDQLDESASLLRILDLSLRAESGERAAFIELHNYAFASNADIILHQYAQKHMIRIHYMFGDEILDPSVAATWASSYTVPTDRLHDYLHSELYTARASGVSTIAKLRLTQYLPDIVEMAFTEPDLHVLQVIQKTLEQEFQNFSPRVAFTLTDFILTPERGRSKFDTQWTAFSEDILKRDPTYTQNNSHKEIINADGRLPNQTIERTGDTRAGDFE